MANHCWMVACDQHLDSPVIAYSTSVDRHVLCYKQTTHQWILFMTDDAERCSEIQHIFAYSGLRGGGGRELTLSPNWHVMLWLDLFKIFAVKRLFRGPKTDPLSFFGLASGYTQRYRHQDLSGIWMTDLLFCKTSHQSVALSLRYWSDTHTPQNLISDNTLH